ncbi:caspase-3-like [Centruroides sculpturatus]|uniref:caspase-3-like n=1 Tax=Centruroides sculpturatus TaxID=218467 RepID=UPI000C6EF8E1|nr:caspase-3-like [Centruroides sculpturatus]
MANYHEDIYKVDYREQGKCLIFYDRIYDGTEIAVKDEQLLRQCFTKLKYDVITYYDLNAKDINKTLKEVAKEDHQNRPSLVCCFLTHGRYNINAGKDYTYVLDKLYKYFNADNCPQLAGKPKLFFIQEFQGIRIDAGVRMDRPHSGSLYTIYPYYDFLFVLSSIPGLVSFREPSGTYFFELLTAVLRENAHKMDLLSMLTVVNKKISLKFESSNEKIQVPHILSTLLKKLYFLCDNEK